jgi:hypothetical protein
MRAVLPGLALTSILVLGCSANQASVVSAVDQPFPADFKFAGVWEPSGVGPLPGSPVRVGTLDGLVKQLDSYFQAFIRVPRAGSGVTIEVPEGAAQAAEVHLFVTIVGGAAAAQSGHQFRLVVYRDANGWWLDPEGESRVYCDHPLGGFGGNSCQ